MGESTLDAIFQPESIAVVGASEKPGSVGGAILTNLHKSGFQGCLSAVNSKRADIHGETAFGSLTEIPDRPELAIICTPAPTVPALVRECGQLGVHGVIVISAGFREAGPAGKELERALKKTSREFPGLRFLGPNCLGVLRPANGLNASFSPVMPSRGGLTFLSQSGALCSAILDWSLERDIGFATCVSVGNMTDIGMGDLIDYFADDDQTDAVLLYIEGVTDAAHFLSAARACSRRKPVIAYKAGRFTESSHAAVSHTGAIASADAVYDAVFRKAGIERANSIEELFDCAQLLVRKTHPQGDRLAIVTNAGGPGVMASDAWLALRGQLASLNSDKLAALDRELPPCWSHGNPIDVLGDASVERFQSAMHHALKDPNVDALLVIVTPQAMTKPELIAVAIVDAQRRTDKPIVASLIGGPSVRSGRMILKKSGVPAYDFPEEAVHALKHLVSSGRMKMADAGCCKRLSDSTGSDGILSNRGITSERLECWRSRLAANKGLLNEARSKELLADYGIPVVPSHIAKSPDEAVELADHIGYPVVLKIISPDISHKTDVGGVALNIANKESVRTGFVSMWDSVRSRVPQANIEGISVQPMISEARGIELLLGMTRDPQFGPVILIGAGGVTAELQKDSILELPPFDDSAIDRMLRSLRLFPLLQGYRGRPGVNLVKLRNVMARFVQLAQDLPELSAAEINPLLVTVDNVSALDARMIS